MERQSDKRLEELRERGVKTYSISRLNSINQCKYGAYLNYIEFLEQKNIGVYGVLGGKIHDKVEECIHGNAIPEDIKAVIQEELDDLEVLGVDFPKDRNGGDSIRNNWVANMTRFAEEFKTPKGNFETEQLLIYPLDDEHCMIGYADAIKHSNDDPNKVLLIDWKTSSQFDKNHLVEAGRQLVLYKLALELQGYEVEGCCWVMMKYCETTWMQKNGKPKTKISEWRNLIKDMSNPIEKALTELGYDEIDIECMLKEGVEKNTWSVFPKEVVDKFKTKPYVRYYEVTPEIEEETLEYIKASIKMYEETTDWTPCDISKQSFFCNALCGYGGSTGQCKYWVDFCDKFNETKEDEDDLF